MEQVTQWTPAVWGAMLVALVLGAMLGIILTRTTNGKVKKQLQLEQALQDAQAQLDEQKQKLEQHFEQSAVLLKTLAEDYKNLYQHLAQSSETLLPEANQLEFFKQPKLEQAQETASSEQGEQPRDYTEGSSGLLKS